MTTNQPTIEDPPDQHDPERLIVVAHLAGAPARFVLVREHDDGPLQLLDAGAPASDTPVTEVVTDVLRARLGVEPAGEVRLCPERRPRRMAQWRQGRVGMGWARAVAVTVSAELVPASPLTGVEVLPLEEAEAALATSLERALLRDGAALIEE